MTLFDTEQQFSMTLGATVLVEETGILQQGRRNLDLIIAKYLPDSEFSWEFGPEDGMENLSPK